ncbi:ABC transporter ATP-binding protein [Cohnella fermenti]|uniref:ABC transporter ATP-binding protein n=1 Tax=Cohnella fermenti TaxID=2565925 RepID=A0A4S4C765_9BACL|nr:ABC transporter ATP-binding protein [Cohnella fermenti]THF83506.1 ABC transporter ATP-binding protein [Cohnella fermenti]
MSLIQLENACKIYSTGTQAVEALDGITMTIEQGEFVAIVGPSGSGKSTLMNIIGCLDVLDRGSYVLDGSDVASLGANKLAKLRNRTIGFVFQQFNLLPKLNVSQNVELPLIYRGMAKEERRQAVAHGLEQVGLTDRRKHRPGELSGGQQQRTAIARALAGNPPLLLADEPTGALDSRTGKDILRLFLQLRDEGRTIVLITHDPAIAAQADRQLRIEDGRLLPL